MLVLVALDDLVLATVLLVLELLEDLVLDTPLAEVDVTLPLFREDLEAIALLERLDLALPEVDDKR